MEMAAWSRCESIMEGVQTFDGDFNLWGLVFMSGIYATRLEFKWRFWTDLERFPAVDTGFITDR